MNLQALRAGMLINGKVSSVRPRALLIQFLELFTGQVDSFHLPPGQRFAEDQKVRARILYVDYESKRVGLSLLPRMCLLLAALFAFPLTLFEPLSREHARTHLRLL